MVKRKDRLTRAKSNKGKKKASAGSGRNVAKAIDALEEESAKGAAAVASPEPTPAAPVPADDAPAASSTPAPAAQNGAVNGASASPGSFEPENGWFTVSRAAEILDVPITKVFDGIRDGKLRVRFQNGEAGETQRPLVSSDELIRGAGGPASVSSANGNGAAKPSSKGKVKAGASVTDPAVQEVARELARLKAEERALRLELAEKDALASEAERALDAERTIRQELERSLATVTAERKDLEDSYLVESEERARTEAELQDERTGRERVEAERQIAVTSLREIERRADTLESEFGRTRTSLEQAEDKLESSLKAVYERDVRIAGLQAKIEATDQGRQESSRYTEKLQERITRMEDRSEEKEKEIRRLALGLGEARGEIRLLRAPEEEARKATRWRRAFPWVMVSAVAVFVLWLAYVLTKQQQAVATGLVAGLITVAGFAAGRFLAQHRRV